MKLSVITESAVRAAAVLKAEADVTRAIAEVGNNESGTIENARKSFQLLLKQSAGLLGELPKFAFELELIDCPENDVLFFVKNFRKAVMQELVKGEHLLYGSDKIMYGEFLSLASNQFVSELKARLTDLDGKKQKVEKIRFTKDMAEKLPDLKEADLGEQPVVKNVVLEEKPVGAAIRQTQKYIDLMAKLRREGKIL